MKYFHIIIGPLSPRDLHFLGDTKESGWIVNKRLLKLNAATLIFYSLHEDRIKTYTFIIIFNNQNILRQEVRQILYTQCMFPIELPIQIKELVGWDSVLISMMVNIDHIKSIKKAKKVLTHQGSSIEWSDLQTFKYFHIIIGPLSLNTLKDLWLTPKDFSISSGELSNWEFKKLLDNSIMNILITFKLNNILEKQKPYSLIVSSEKEGKGILFNVLAKFTDSYPPSDIRWMLENMYREPYSYPPSDCRYKLQNLYLDPTTFPIQVWGIADWDYVLQTMMVEDPYIHFDVSPEDWPSIRRINKLIKIMRGEL